MGYVLGVAIGVGVIVGFARHQHTRSKRRADLVSKNFRTARLFEFDVNEDPVVFNLCVFRRLQLHLLRG